MVVIVTGAARGQGRSHCVRFAERGASVVAIDIAADIPDTPYDQSTSSDLDETARLIESAGGSALPVVADVRDRDAMAVAVARTVETFGSIDVVCANAGVTQIKPATQITTEDWETVIGINVTGTWNTIAAALPTMLEANRGGSIVITSSVAGLKGVPGMAHYATSKSALIGLTRALAVELGPAGIRVNCVAPTMVDTPMLHWDEAYRAFRPDLEAPTVHDVEGVFASGHPLGVPWVDAIDVTEVVDWLVSDEARYVTGAVVPVDAGALIS